MRAFALLTLSSIAAAAPSLRLSGSASTKDVAPMSVIGGYPNNPYFAVYSSYSDSSCTELLTLGTQVLDTCQAGSSASKKYECVDGVVTQYVYSDTNCFALDSNFSFPVGECYADTLFERCNGKSATDLDFGDFTAQVFYAASTAANCGNELSSFGYVNGQCYDNGDGTSYEYDYPNFYSYSSSSDCSGTPTTTDVSAVVCNAISGVDDATEYGSYTQYFDVVSAKHHSFHNLHRGQVAAITLLSILAAVVVFGILYCVISSRLEMNRKLSERGYARPGATEMNKL